MQRELLAANDEIRRLHKTIGDIQYSYIKQNAEKAEQLDNANQEILKLQHEIKETQAFHVKQLESTNAELRQLKLKREDSIQMRQIEDYQTRQAMKKELRNLEQQILELKTVQIGQTAELENLQNECAAKDRLIAAAQERATQYLCCGIIFETTWLTRYSKETANKLLSLQREIEEKIRKVPPHIYFIIIEC